MRMIDLIEKKKEKIELTKEEITFIINGYVAKEIPDYQIRRSITRQISNKEKLIVVYCSTGHRSQEAQRILENMGYTNVYNVYEGVLI